MEGNDSDGSPRSERISTEDGGGLIMVSQGHSINEDVTEHENHNPKSDAAPKDSDVSDEENTLVCSKRRIQLMSDSDGGSADETVKKTQQESDLLASDNDSQSGKSSTHDTSSSHKSVLQKSQIRKMSTSGEESGSEANSQASNSNVGLKSILQKSRISKVSRRGEESDSDANSNASSSNVGHKIALQKSRIRKMSTSSEESGSDANSNASSSNADHKKVLQKSQIRKMSTSSDISGSDANSKASSGNDDKEESRIKSKRNKLKQKFENMHSKRNRKTVIIDNVQENIIAEEKNKECQSSSDEASVEKIKQVIKQGAVKLDTLSSLYDPDTSDDESNAPSNSKAAPKKPRKSTKLTSPKPQRMSAKQAMENMQKIKSESNRMLREKEVSLPYHRPKALTLKDIMSRRRAAVTPDGKALPIKMNNEQLKQYADILEQRQREVIELCKSDTEDEEEVEKTENNVENLPEIPSLSDTLYDDFCKSEGQINGNADESLLNSETKSPGQGDSNEIENIEKVNCIERQSLDNENNIEEVCNTEKVEENPANESLPKTNDVEPMSIDTRIEEPITDEQTNKAIDENNSIEMELVYNDSVEETDKSVTEKAENIDNTKKCKKPASEVESQFISLHYDTEKLEYNNQNTEILEQEKDNKHERTHEDCTEKPDDDRSEMRTEEIENNMFSDDDMNMEDIDALIENAEIAMSQTNCDNVSSPMLIKDPIPLTGIPKLTGAPGMVINLDGTDPLVPKKLSGVELLKERFVYFSKLKTPEEQEREREKRIKPGMQHLKLKLELEQQIAEQKSLEWAKRLEEEKNHQKELNALRGEGSDAEDDIDAIEAKLEEKEDAIEKENSTESEEEEEEEEELNEELVDKPRKRNPMVDDEAEESYCDNEGEGEKQDMEMNEENNDDADNEADESEEESSEESEESEDEQQNKPKKGRILKAFEDSDDEDANKEVESDSANKIKDMQTITKDKEPHPVSQAVKTTQDDELHLAQKSVSDDLFTSQEGSVANSDGTNHTSNVKDNSFEDKQIGTQTFSILESNIKNSQAIDFPMPDTLSLAPETQSFTDSENLDAVVGMCSGSFSQTQNFVPTSQIAAEDSISQAIGDDVLALCTGKFYDNQFLSQEDSENKETSSKEQMIEKIDEDLSDATKGNNDVNIEDTAGKQTQHNIENDGEKEPKEHKIDENINKKNTSEDPNLLKSILDELNNPEFDTPKPNKYFASNDSQDKENEQILANAQFKKKFVIDSDDEDKEQDTNPKKKKKIRKKKLEQRALQISDDEESQNEAEDYESELEEDEGERIVEYDSEENEVIVQTQQPKKKRKLGEFFEQEAELTSEDEWVGSGDEDEAGLDRMEREEGDDDKFNEKQLQRELGQIHMRDVLDQDKREVRLIQELLFEDGDLGGGSRQRKFRWRNADGSEETGTMPDEFADTQEEEYESEEQWRKQRHEREMFLKSLKQQEGPDESLDVSMTRTSIIKANLSKNASNIFVDVNNSIEEIQAPPLPPPNEKKTVTAKDIPSPKKPFTIFQQNYHGSLLTRGRGALARLAALATPLANDDDSPKVGNLKPTSKRNFVFASIDAPQPEDDEPKVNKRKADSNAGTPRLVKKLRTEDKQNLSKASLLDHIKI